MGYDGDGVRKGEVARALDRFQGSGLQSGFLRARAPGPGCRGAAWRCYAYAEQKYSSLRFLHVHRVQVKNAVSSYSQAW